MADYQALGVEVNQPEYLGLTNLEIAQALNTPMAGQAIPIPLGALAGYVEMAGIMERAEVAAADPNAGAQVKAICRKIIRFASNSTPISVIDMTDATSAATIDTMLAALVAAGIITDVEKAGILALGRQQTTLAIEIFGVPVTETDVAAVRA